MLQVNRCSVLKGVNLFCILCPCGITDCDIWLFVQCGGGAGGERWHDAGLVQCGGGAGGERWYDAARHPLLF